MITPKEMERHERNATIMAFTCCLLLFALICIHSTEAMMQSYSNCIFLCFVIAAFALTYKFLFLECRQDWREAEARLRCHLAGRPMWFQEPT